MARDGRHGGSARRSASMRTTRAMGKRPDHVKPPAYLSKSPPVPAPDEASQAPSASPDPREPTRYGDWEHKGIAVDF